MIPSAPGWAAGPIDIVAAENFYGDVAQQIGGADVEVTSILTNPDQDPHLFEASPSCARALSGARIVIYNGIDYDPWMTKLLGARPRAADRKLIVVADAGRRKGRRQSAHLVRSATMPAAAKALARRAGRRRPGTPGRFPDAAGAVRNVAAIRPDEDRRHCATLAGTPVTATEPVFGYMATALGLKMRNERVPARGDEQHRAERMRVSPRSRTT